jgi:transcriptional regulator with XRE-family HTH domain
MESRDVILMARQRAGITQQQLADRSGRPRETIARWETGAREPSLATLRRMVSACDLELVIRLAKRDESLDELVADQLEISPEERLRRLMSTEAREDALRALRWIGVARTPAIVLGAVAAVLQGSPQRADRGHVEIVSSDRYSIEVEMRNAGFTPIDAEARWQDVDRREPWALPDGGAIVLAVDVPGADAGYADLRRSAEKIVLDDGTSVAVAHPRDLLRLGDASSREGERARGPALRALLAQRRGHARRA